MRKHYGRTLKGMTVGPRGRLDFSLHGGWQVVKCEQALSALAGTERADLPPGVAEVARWREHLDPWVKWKQQLPPPRTARLRLEDRRDVMRNVICARTMGVEGEYMSITGLVRMVKGDLVGRFGRLVVDDDGHGAWIDLLAGGRVLLSKGDFEPWLTPISRHLSIAIRRVNTIRSLEDAAFAKAQHGGLAYEIAHAVQCQRKRLHAEADLIEAELGEVMLRWSAQSLIGNLR